MDPHLKEISNRGGFVGGKGASIDGRQRYEGRRKMPFLNCDARRFRIQNKARNVRITLNRRLVKIKRLVSASA